MENSEIRLLNDLALLRTAPVLKKVQRNRLLSELNGFMSNSDWFTIGVMATSSKIAINVIREIEKYFKYVLEWCVKAKKSNS